MQRNRFSIESGGKNGDAPPADRARTNPRLEAPTEALARLLKEVAQAQKDLLTFLQTSVDIGKARLRRAALFLVLWAAAGIGIIAAITLALGHLFDGMARGVGESVGRLWLGQAIVGLVILGALSGGATIYYRRGTRVRGKILEKYRK